MESFISIGLLCDHLSLIPAMGEALAGMIAS
jgi:hypothetical protein